MSHPNDISPYLSRECLFEKIRRLEIDNDNLHERIRKLESAFVSQSEHVEIPSDLDYDEYAERLPV